MKGKKRGGGGGGKAQYLDSFLPMHLNGWKIEIFTKVRQALGTVELGGKREAGVHSSALQV